jgi:hypothetical protein
MLAKGSNAAPTAAFADIASASGGPVRQGNGVLVSPRDVAPPVTTQASDTITTVARPRRNVVCNLSIRRDAMSSRDVLGRHVHVMIAAAERVD